MQVRSVLSTLAAPPGVDHENGRLVLNTKTGPTSVVMPPEALAGIQVGGPYPRVVPDRR